MYTRVTGKYGVFYVDWFGLVIPPGVKKGAKIHGVGDLHTYDSGSVAKIKDALVLRPRKVLALRRELALAFAECVTRPDEYMEYPDAPVRLAVPNTRRF